MNKINTQLSDIEILIDQIDQHTNSNSNSNHIPKTHKNNKSKYDEKVFEEYIKRAKKSKRNSKIHFRLDKFRQAKKDRTTYGQIKYELEKLQISTNYHWIVIFLVALDCFCIGAELLIEFIQLTLINEEFNLASKTLSKDVIKLNETFILINSTNPFLFSIYETSNFHKILFNMEIFFKYLGTSILGLFIIEFFIKAIFIPRNFFFKIWEFIDAFIVVLSFSLNIYLFNRSHAVHSIIGLITLLRLWRITEIINAIVMVIETRNENKIEKLYKTVKFLDTKNEKMREKIFELEKFLIKKDEDVKN
ncbi:unnamed protein product [Brachionus calyciflorus]|uniref:Voltage-gated hydrogen channel 1 n=1 Tax=Brachionus calyciflorus TaxID=104777 RepID=A0A813TVT4_9BILA|nr:unnamed protein product [Brachionus calyciflorus]